MKSLGQKILMAKFPYDEMYSRQNFLTVKYPHDEVPNSRDLAAKSRTAQFPKSHGGIPQTVAQCKQRETAKFIPVHLQVMIRMS